MSAPEDDGLPGPPAAGDSIFLDHDGRLARLTARPYLSETDLQRLVADYPDLLAGGQIDPASPRRWLLVAREMAVASEEDGPRRWSLDHLFLDQDRTPTLVEVKRSGDIRIRREVVGQMLDYAANGALHWTVERIRSRFEARCLEAGLEPASEVQHRLDPGGDAELFWLRVQEKLRDGAIRLVFVADVIPPELRRVVEFLNDQMNPAEVLAIEIRQYVGEGLRTLVPRLVGQTAEAQRRKSAKQGEARVWDEASFFEACRKQNGEDSSAVARRLLDWASASGRAWFGRGQRSGSFGHAMRVGGEDRYSFVVRTSGSVEISLQWLRYAPPFNDESKRRELLDRLNSIEGVSLPADRLDGRPGIKLAALASPNRLSQFTAVLDWVVAEIRAADADGRETRRAG